MTDPFNTPHPSFMKDKGIFWAYQPAPPHPAEIKASDLKPGVFSVTSHPSLGIGLHPLTPAADKLIRFPKGCGAELLDEITSFLSTETEARYKQFGYIHKRGILVHGKPGTGKTSLFNQITKDFVDDGGFVLYNPSPALLSGAMDLLRQRLPESRVLVIFEEFESTILDWESLLLQLLDGMLTHDRFVVLASTNYIDQIPLRFRARPSRFASVIEIPGPNLEMRQQYLQQMVPEAVRLQVGDQLTEIAEKTEGFTLDGLKDVVISAFCLQQPLDECIAKARAAAVLLAKEEEEANG